MFVDPAGAATGIQADAKKINANEGWKQRRKSGMNGPFRRAAEKPFLKRRIGLTIAQR